ncbi:MAG TPA: hypothetical protein ENF21_03065 [Bacteroidetes bacterium]|nr:hypothetical protein [Bacteroidota bacterium]
MKNPLRNRNHSKDTNTIVAPVIKELKAENYRYHDLTPEQWYWAVSMIKEFELNKDGARILIDEIKKGNFVFE